MTLSKSSILQVIIIIFHSEPSLVPAPEPAIIGLTFQWKQEEEGRALSYAGWNSTQTTLVALCFDRIFYFFVGFLF